MEQSFSNLSPFSRDHIMAELRIDQTRSAIRNGQTNNLPPAATRHYTPWLRDDFTLSCAVTRLFFFLPLFARQLGPGIIRSLLLENGFFAAERKIDRGLDCKLETIGECHDEIEPLRECIAVGKLCEAVVTDFLLEYDARDQTFALLPQEEAKLAQTAATKGLECFVEEEM